uniref:Platelet-activating factor acetylhydrolase IB subunit alpha1 n=1 Tax=Aotus nancymaae TaxID=37293 RepID=A0A2K5D8E3_AOTNA
MAASFQEQVPLASSQEEENPSLTSWEGPLKDLLHHRFVADSKDKEPEVVFIGDSLVQLMHQCEIWRELVSPLHALNFGIGGDRTQHVLWRLENGELEHIRPKIVVVWVGTNNHGHTAEQVTGGIKAIVQLVNERQPQARVVVLGLLPRGQGAGHWPLCSYRSVFTHSSVDVLLGCFHILAIINSASVNTGVLTSLNFKMLLTGSSFSLPSP